MGLKLRSSMTGPDLKLEPRELIAGALLIQVATTTKL